MPKEKGTTRLTKHSMPSTVKKSISAATIKKLAQYKREKRRQIAFYAIGYSAVLIGGFFLFMYLAGDYFNGVLSKFGMRGLSNMMSGVYTDCSRPENRYQDFCQPPKSRADRQWQTIRRRGTTQSAAFGLD